ncbi:hypothetical protein LB516_16290 [Mesorhizobium sp. CO1-1-7]|uniref:hypothetical protein n=1 Tax=Mesorhizobium sp. CO1-1-7 TaxID=2876632 RepID=UPI001CD0D180|nr:hypothetical protein [Mesorhizobium sp. CO1-1-7]MBZ9746809.1 hypothetical protein [Mesorhizobium sp. CO1-1-7]
MASETTIASAAIVERGKIARNRKEIGPALLPVENGDAAPLDDLVRTSGLETEAKT